MISTVAENQKTGENIVNVTIGGAGDLTNLGFARKISINSGDTQQFSCSGNGTVLDIYRIGYYGGSGWRKATSIVNTATAQPDPVAVANSNGATHCANWSTTATWTVPPDAKSGLYCGVLRNAAGNNASYIPFVVRNDDEEVDIVYMTSESTWGAAYNHFGTMASPLSGKNLYGSGSGVGNIVDRCHYVSYMRPIITRQQVPQTYWMACELPVIRFLEQNGYSVKYITCADLDRDPSILNKGKIFLCSGHSEYWSQNMRSNFETYRDDANGYSFFMAANAVFWQIRYDSAHEGYWCYKDTMPGPGGHTAGTSLDPLGWTGTWKDTRRPGFNINYHPEWMVLGTDFRMNGVNDFDAVILQNPYGGHPVWGGSSLVDADLTLTRVIGFEADAMRAMQPVESKRVLAGYTRNINGLYADNNGQNYSGNGSLEWGVVAQCYEGGGRTVGFGTCQWGWMLNNIHDRGNGTEVSPAAQQFTLNLFRDFGATPESPQSGLVIRPANAITEYGLQPGATQKDTIFIRTGANTYREAEIIGVGQNDGTLRDARVLVL